MILRKHEAKLAEAEEINGSLQRKIDELLIQKKKTEESLTEEQKQKTKFLNELEVIEEKLKTTQNSLKDNGDKNKRVVEKNVQEIKKLKEDIIALNSEVELKVFMI